MSSYKSILKSTGLIALVQVVQLIFGLVRNKVVAAVLGTSGFGIWGLYQTYIEMVSSFSTLGIDQSGVREIAKNDDSNEVAKSIFILRRALLTISLITSLASIIFSKAISLSLFRTEDYYLGITIVSFVILFNGISKGQKSILNGLRDMRGLAISQILGSAIGSIATVILVYFIGLDGIPLYLFIVSLTGVIATWWFVNKLGIRKVVPSITESKVKIRNLIYLGLGFSVTAVIASVMTYFSRTYLSNQYDFSTVGIYQASWTISNLYIGIILSAMGVDFMPRLVKVIGDNSKLTALVNEQMELGTLISSIGVVFILLFSSFILEILYSIEFISGKEIIRWQILGVALRVLGFPFSHSIMAKNKPLVYITVQSVFWISDYLLLIVFSKLFGVNGLGINYFVSYIIYLIAVWTICSYLFEFKSTSLLKKIILISFSFITASWVVSNYFSGIYFWLMTITLLMSMAIWINYYLSKHMNLSIITLITKKTKR